jgi:hypothetical protein
MSLDEVLENRKNLILERDQSYRFVYKELDVNEKVDSITYYFGKKNNYPFYEVIIKFKDGVVVHDESEKLFGKANNRNQWLFKNNEFNTTFFIYAWMIRDGLVIGGGIKDTEFNSSKWKGLSPRWQDGKRDN